MYLASARVGVDDGGLVVPVDADRTKALRGRDNAKSDGVDAPVYRPPVGRDAVQMAARPAAADFRVCVVLHAPVARRHLDCLAELGADGLHLLDELRVNHLRVQPHGQANS